MSSAEFTPPRRCSDFRRRPPAARFSPTPTKFLPINPAAVFFVAFHFPQNVLRCLGNVLRGLRNVFRGLRNVLRSTKCVNEVYEMFSEVYEMCCEVYEML